ncbi:MAG: ABC transporter ATP-binding protein [Bacteroidales bacterium]
MKKIKLLNESVRLVWVSAPAWTAANVAISLLRSFVPLVLLFLIKTLVDEITAGVAAGEPDSFATIVRTIIAVTVVFLIDELSSEAGNYVRKKQSYRLEEYMYRLLQSKAIALDLINFENPSYFDKLSRAVREATWRPNNILNNFIALFRGIISLLLMAGLLLTLNWWIAILLVAVNVPGIWLRLHYASLIYNFRREETPEERKAGYFNWLLTGDRPSREIRLFGSGNYFISLFRKSFKHHKEKEINIIRKRTQIDTVSGCVKACALFMVLYIIAGETIRGSITLGGMAMLILAFRQGLVYIRDILGSVAGLYEDTLFTGDIFEFLSLREKIIAEEPTIAASPLQKEIRIENVTFTYPGNSSPALKNINLWIKKGEVVALVGPNGSGKSTLVRILCRLYDPDTGTIFYDGKNIRNIDPAEYRKNFSVLFQDFMLYNLTAEENIMLGDVEAEKQEERIYSAAKSAGIHSLIESLPRGYDTYIGPLFDESRELSWGEWQKIALARTIYRNASVMVLDEPSSALDSASEYEIFSRFREIMKEKTVLLISHRFTSVRLADRIIVLERGKIIENGSHSELMLKKGLYYDMFIRQKSMMNETENAG